MNVIVVSLPFSPNVRRCGKKTFTRRVAARLGEKEKFCQWAQRGWVGITLNPLASRSWHKIQRGGIDAVAQARGRRSVVEHVPQMPAAPRTMDFGPAMEQLPIRLRANGLFGNRFPEARPASVDVVLGVGGEKGQVASGAVIGARLLVRVILVGKGPLRPILAQHPVLLWRQDLPPLFVRLRHLKHVSRLLGHSWHYTKGLRQYAEPQRQAGFQKGSPRHGR